MKAIAVVSLIFLATLVANAQTTLTVDAASLGSARVIVSITSDNRSVNYVFVDEDADGELDSIVQTINEGSSLEAYIAGVYYNVGKTKKEIGRKLFKQAVKGRGIEVDDKLRRQILESFLF